MTVPSARQVFGPVRANTLHDWWEPTRANAPLTPRMAYYLRRRMWSSTPGIVQKALAERGLLSKAGLTREGERVRDLLGELPHGCWPSSRAHYQVAPSEVIVECRSCGRDVNAELIAWGLYDGVPDAATPPCVACAMEGGG